MKCNDTARVWTIRYTRPRPIVYANGETRVFAHNHCSTVIAASVAQAVELLMQEFTDATIVAVNPGSTGPILVDAMEMASE